MKNKNKEIFTTRYEALAVIGGIVGVIGGILVLIKRCCKWQKL
jgi:hypothetical protein